MQWSRSSIVHWILRSVGQRVKLSVVDSASSTVVGHSHPATTHLLYYNIYIYIYISGVLIFLTSTYSCTLLQSFKL